MHKLFSLLIVLICGIVSIANADGLRLLDENAETHQHYSDSLFTISVHNLSLTVDAMTGGRVTSLKIGEQELLTLKEVHPNYYGSTLWLSPQGKWEGHGLLDRGPYKVKRSENSTLRLKSQNDHERGFAFSKEFSGSTSDTVFVIRYTITNISDEMQTVAPWEVTRVPTGGLAFFPKGDHPPLSKSNLTIRDSLDIIWYPYDASLTTYQKLFMNGDEGWQAHVQDGMIFIKQFPEITPEETAPGEENVEIYVNPENTYIELENQGAYQPLTAGASLTYEVRWHVRRLPEHINTGIGSMALVEYVRGIID